MNVDTLSRRPSTSPRTSAAAVPRTTSSGVEYFMGVHLLSGRDVEALPTQLKPALQLQDRGNFAAGLAAAVGERLDRGAQLVAIDPAALDDLQAGGRKHRGDRAPNRTKRGRRVITLRDAAKHARWN